MGRLIVGALAVFAANSRRCLMRWTTFGTLAVLCLSKNLVLGAAGAGLTITQSDLTQGGNFDPKTQTAKFNNGDGPLALSIRSALPGTTRVSISTGVSIDRPWLGLFLLKQAGDTCPFFNDGGYSNVVGFSVTSAAPQTICVGVADMPANSLYAGTLSFQTPAGTTVVSVSYKIVPPAYLHIYNGDQEITSDTPPLVIAQAKSLNLMVKGVDPNSPRPVNVPVDIDPTADKKPGWLSISEYHLDGLPGSLTVGVDPAAAKMNDSAILHFESYFGYGATEFSISVQPPETSSLPNPLVGVWRPSTAVWWLAPPGLPPATPWGMAGDMPVPADYDGDGIIDPAVWRPTDGTWWVIPSRAGSNSYLQQWGLPGDIPVPGDYNTAGQFVPAVFRPSSGNWYISPSEKPVPWGLPGDIPVPGHYSGGGLMEIAVFRPSSGNWYISPSETPTQFGLLGDMPVPADYNGDHTTDLAVWRPSTGNWYVSPNGPSPIQLGLNGDMPLPADYDGDGKMDIAVWRPTNGTWYIIPSTSPTKTPAIKQWGLPGDVPLGRIP